MISENGGCGEGGVVGLEGGGRWVGGGGLVGRVCVCVCGCGGLVAPDS